jgi:hypothetical protein
MKILLILPLLILLSCASPEKDYFSAQGKAQESGICDVHHIAMYKEKVEIAYGLLIEAPGSPSFDIIATQFPHSEHFIAGGCVISEDSPKYGYIYICPLCEAAKKRWLNSQNLNHRLRFIPKKA